MTLPIKAAPVTKTSNISKITEELSLENFASSTCSGKYASGPTIHDVANHQLPPVWVLPPAWVVQPPWVEVVITVEVTVSVLVTVSVVLKVSVVLAVSVVVTVSVLVLVSVIVNVVVAVHQGTVVVVVGWQLQLLAPMLVLF
jgi:hypothetical protein